LLLQYYEKGVHLTNIIVIGSKPELSSDHMIVVKPNYATNIETPRTIGTSYNYIVVCIYIRVGCDVSFYNLQFDEEWKLNIDRLRQILTPATKLISITTPHNPTGTNTVLLSRGY